MARVRYFSEGQVKEQHLPTRGRLILSLTSAQDPEIPEFLQDRITVHHGVVPCQDRDGREMLLTGDAAARAGYKTKPGRVIRINCIDHGGEVHEGQVAAVEYRLFCVRFDGDVAYHYVLSLL